MRSIFAPHDNDSSAEFIACGNDAEERGSRSWSVRGLIHSLASDSLSLPPVGHMSAYSNAQHIPGPNELFHDSSAAFERSFPTLTSSSTVETSVHAAIAPVWYDWRRYVPAPHARYYSSVLACGAGSTWSSRIGSVIYYLQGKAFSALLSAGALYRPSNLGRAPLDQNGVVQTHLARLNLAPSAFRFL
jgi:hypothetical protein